MDRALVPSILTILSTLPSAGIGALLALQQADTLAAMVVDGVEPEPGKVSKARLQFDAYRWHAGKLAPKKYGDRISHDVKGGGINFQPQILISCSSAGEEQEYIDISAPPEAANSLPQQGNGNSLPGSGGRPVIRTSCALLALAAIHLRGSPCAILVWLEI